VLALCCVQIADGRDHRVDLRGREPVPECSIFGVLGVLSSEIGRAVSDIRLSAQSG